MKKKIIAYIIITLAAASCVRVSVNEPYEQDTTLYRTGEVTLLCSIEDFSTKAQVDANGHGLWKKNDTIIVLTASGKPVPFALDGTGETKRALFKGVIPSGETLGSLAVYPSSAFVGYADGKVSVRTPSLYSQEDNKFCGVMVSRIEDSFEITFQQLFSYANITFTRFPVKAKTLVLKEDGRRISGDFVFDEVTGAATGITAVEGTGSITVDLSKSLTSFNLLLPLPVATYKNLSATAYDEEGKEIVAKKMLTMGYDMPRGALQTLSCEMPKVVIDGTILLNGVYWAKGNLLRDASVAAEDGFQEGWTLAPQQWYSVGYDLRESVTSSGTYKYDGTNSADFRYTIDGSLCDHFNFGGIKKDSGYIFDSNDQNNVMNNNANFNICGRMFTDREGVNATDDFSAAKFGDLAYWASNGQFRMPSKEEFEALKGCDYVCGHFTDPATGMKIWGLCFTEPVNPSAPDHVYGDSEITAEQIESGLFLPIAGRRANSNSMVIWYRSQGIYWAGDAVAKSETAAKSGDESQYSWTFYITKSGTELLNYRADAFDRRAGFCIRPVLN